MGFLERIRLLFRLFLLFTFLAILALISAITTIKLTIQSNQESMPDLVGMNIEAAQGVAGGLGLVIKVDDKLFNAKYAENEVISQEPRSRAYVKAGQHVHVLVSLGAPRIVVPDLVGSTARVAQIVAVERGLTVGDVAKVYWPGTQPGEIVAQDPASSSGAIRSPAISFLVSLGQTPASFVCPDFEGMEVNQVRTPIKSAGFTVGAVTTVADPSAPSGVILSQSPPPGSKIVAGATFTFQVAR
jgi:eukaryotic-like serine/threonine-protein kinase